MRKDAKLALLRSAVDQRGRHQMIPRLLRPQVILQRGYHESVERSILINHTLCLYVLAERAPVFEAGILPNDTQFESLLVVSLLALAEEKYLIVAPGKQVLLLVALARAVLEGHYQRRAERMRAVKRAILLREIPERNYTELL